MTNRYLCIHGHFYQPPREDPLSGEIPSEPGAAPYQNWNERIYSECYRPNAALGNFSRISFDIGPTLCAWMESAYPNTLQNIIAQDRVSMHQYGVGGAIALTYNHTILPLATRRDKITQVVWGIADFEHRFGRKPQGMWLPETAVDLETLSILADHGILFTILAPWQAQQQDLDLTEPYMVSLPGDRRITVFFYHGDLSAGISFNPDLTTNADLFAKNVLIPHYSRPKARRKTPQIILLATDGELYGHHQPLRDYFLAQLLNHAADQMGFQPTLPEMWLKYHPAQEYVTIRENTSWSCHHGVERWSNGCKCTQGDSRWKAGLRAALDTLADSLDAVYQDEVRPHVADPWVLRDAYIRILLGQQRIEKFIEEMAGKELPEQKITRIKLLLRAQFERQRMFTSCAWFFEDLDRIEPRNILAYAAHAVHLTRQATNMDLSEGIQSQLKQVVSTKTGLRADSVFLDQLQLAQKPHTLFT